MSNVFLIQHEMCYRHLLYLAETYAQFADLDKSYFQKCVHMSEDRWTKCIALEGNHMIKNKNDLFPLSVPNFRIFAVLQSSELSNVVRHTKILYILCSAQNMTSWLHLCMIKPVMKRKKLFKYIKMLRHFDFVNGFGIDAIKPSKRNSKT